MIQYNLAKYKLYEIKSEYILYLHMHTNILLIFLIFLI